MLDVQELSIAIGGKLLVKRVSFSVQPNECVALVGESGSGKSLTAHALLRLLPEAEISGQVWFQGENLLDLSEAAMRAIRGKGVGMIFQDAIAALNPTMRVGSQLAEAGGTVEHLRQVGIADPERRLHAFPHECSGGMCQRIMLAMALAQNPLLLIADEPTTSLDVTVQAQIIELLKSLTHMSLLLISHNLSVVAGLCQRVIVMKEGEIVEQGTTEQIFYQPQHAYTQELLASVSRCY